MQGLTYIIYSSDSPHISGMALLAKTEIALSPKDVYRDVLDAVYSFSDETKEFGLTAIAEVLKNDKTNTYNSGWQADTSLKQVVESIADDDEANLKIRRKALALMDEYY